MGQGTIPIGRVLSPFTPTPLGTADDPLRFLMVEDRRDDVELEERELRAAGLEFISRQVDSDTGFRHAVHDFVPHLILCDYSLPGASGMDILRLARNLCPDTPFIFVSGTIGEERAVEALKTGAVDYVLKDRLSSLPLRVRRALREAEERRERQALELQLRHAQKVEVMGQLAGGVAHDFNNLLTVIGGFTALTLDTFSADDPRRADLEEIQKATKRGSDLTRQLLAFARRQALAPTVIDLNTVIDHTRTMLERLIGEDIQFVTVLAENLGRVQADAGQIEQVMMNLVINARDAMPNGGTLTIETQDVELDDGYVRAHTGVQAGRYVMIAVSDTGVGMPREVLSRLFEPFFTTKAPGHGTGLGLATAYGIVRQSGGDIWVYSEVGQGTTFKVYLPCVEQPLDEAAARPTHGSLRGTETVLLAEDDRAVRVLARRVLEAYGYRVLEATDGGEAIDVAKRHNGHIDLLVTDVVMPQMSGREVADAVAAIVPGIRTLYLSGYTASVIARRNVLESGMSFLEKPFTPTSLAAKVREVLTAAKE
jgi:two-component system, cell cycle sensor histidine kinase and response regulator CckA